MTAAIVIVMVNSNDSDDDNDNNDKRHFIYIGRDKEVYSRKTKLNK